MESNYILTIAIPTYNRKKDLCKLLDCIKPQLDNRVEIIVYDNNSTDGTQATLKNEYPWVMTYTNSENVGPDRNFLNCYYKSKGNYILLMGSDDLLARDAISNILNFIDNCGCEPDLIYLNNSLFEETNNDGERIVYTYLDGYEDGIITDRDDFLRITKCRITFMSCIVMNKSVFCRVKNPSIYFDTSFIHTCIFFEGTQFSNCFGVIYSPCVLANVTKGAAELDTKLNDFLLVFTCRMKDVLCNIGPRFGLDRKLMKNLFINEIYKSTSLRILKSKINKLDIKDSFWKYTYPNVCEFPIAWITIILSYFTPRCIAIIIYKFIKPLFLSVKKFKMRRLDLE